jgi:hypothetical protein
MRPRRAPWLAQLLLAALLGPLTLPAPAQAQIAFSADLGANEVNGTFATSLSITTSTAAPAGASILCHLPLPPNKESPPEWSMEVSTVASTGVSSEGLNLLGHIGFSDL